MSYSRHRRSSTVNPRRLRLEGLLPRTLLAGVTSELSGGIALVSGTPANDQIIIAPMVQRAEVHIFDLAECVSAWPQSDVREVNVQSLAGNDVVRVGDAMTSPVKVTGGSGVDTVLINDPNASRPGWQFDAEQLGTDANYIDAVKAGHGAHGVTLPFATLSPILTDHVHVQDTPIIREPDTTDAGNNNTGNVTQTPVAPEPGATETGNNGVGNVTETPVVREPDATETNINAAETSAGATSTSAGTGSRFSIGFGEHAAHIAAAASSDLDAADAQSSHAGHSQNSPSVGHSSHAGHDQRGPSADHSSHSGHSQHSHSADTSCHPNRGPDAESLDPLPEPSVDEKPKSSEDSSDDDHDGDGAKPDDSGREAMEFVPDDSSSISPIVIERHRRSGMPKIEGAPPEWDAALQALEEDQEDAGRLAAAGAQGAERPAMTLPHFAQLLTGAGAIGILYAGRSPRSRVPLPAKPGPSRDCHKSLNGIEKL